ncbi:MAG: hypothetical protein CMN76_01835 [Spirochaetaceae bacterium]|nr:hypothetical protein [Spirochaetaceae bacterium]|tara:strand:- start:17365 stop:18672 length:1308 start_codon:yes stop_codon:yes gene_type:complete
MHENWLESEFASLYLEQLLKESVLASGRTAPNPTVAALAFDSNTPARYAAGATEPAGKRHAEIVALDGFRQRYGVNPDSIAVTLEPCSKTGRTPPCVDRILSIPELQYIYIGGLDPALSGEGVERLRVFGRKVYLPETAFRQGPGNPFHSGSAPHLYSFLSGLQRLYGLFPGSFAHRLLYGRPRLYLKAASDPTGCMGDRKRRVSVSGPEGLLFGQLLRRACDAVLVGPKTVLVDEPSLDWRPAERMERSAIDSRSDSGKPEKLLRAADPFMRALLRYTLEDEMQSPEFPHQPVRIFLLPEAKEGHEKALHRFKEKQQAIFEKGGPEPVFWTLSKKHTAGDLPALKDPVFGSTLLQSLTDLGLNTVLVEGGAGLHRALGSSLQPDDRFYWIQSQNALDLSSLHHPVMMPDFLRSLPRLESVKLGQDELVAFAGRP